MTTGLKTIIYPVEDLGQAKAVYGALLGGVEPVMDQAYYVQFNVGSTEVGLDPHGHTKGMTGPVSYWHVEDIKQTVAELLAAGAEVQAAVTEFGGRLVGSVRDADGNVIGLIQTTSGSTPNAG